MLRIYRNEGEGIHIGDSIQVKVLSSKNSVTLGIEAPDDTLVLRSELLESPRRREKDYGPIAFIAWRLYVQENNNIRWSEVPPELAITYRQRAENLVRKFRTREIQSGKRPL